MCSLFLFFLKYFHKVHQKYNEWNCEIYLKNENYEVLKYYSSKEVFHDLEHLNVDLATDLFDHTFDIYAIELLPSLSVLKVEMVS